MPDQYPKSREELEAEVEQLKRTVSDLTAALSLSDTSLRFADQQIETLKRRRPPRVLDPKAADAFARPAFSRR